VKRAAAEAGYSAAFAVGGGIAGPSSDRYAIERIEILRGDTGLRFLWKVWRGRPLSSLGARP
jgi:hypothetical protein